MGAEPLEPDGNRSSFRYSHDTYDPLSRLTGAAYPGAYGNWSWTYDPVGNRATQAAPSGTTSYTYDANNRLSQAGTVTYDYDPNGNLLSTSAGQTFTWDPFNRLTNASGSGGAVTYTYNGDGLKVRRTGPDGVTVYYHDGIRPIWETDGAGTSKAQLDRDIFGNLLSRREVNGTRRYFAHDGLGGITGVTEEAGSPVASLFYDAWGNIRATGGTWTGGNYRFAGAELDPATGLYHMGARFYEPGLGRWLSEDPMQDKHFEPSTLNFYAYMVEAYSFLEKQMGITQDMLVLGVISSIALAMTLNPSQDTDFGKLVADYRRNPGNWRVAYAWTEASRRYKGGSSTRFIYQRVSDGAAIGYQFNAVGHRIVHQHFAEGTWRNY